MIWVSSRISEGPVASQRKHLCPFVVTFLAVLAPSSSWAATPDILLPEPFAVELPADTTTLETGSGPLRRLLAGVQAGGDRVTVAMPRDRVGAGAWRVILSAWDAGVRDRPVARREAVLVVVPHGMTPVGATGIGGGALIARDDAGFVHMVWTDAWRAGAREGAMYRRGQVMPDGSVQLDSEILDLAPHRGNWTAAPTLAAAENTVHFTWQADGTTRYRSLTRVGSDWRWSDEVDTKAASGDQGTAIAADANTVHILSGDGHYMASRDGGRTWTTETVPFGTFARLGTLSLTLDASGRPLAAAAVLVSEATQAAAGPGKGARWTLRLARRIGNGAWQALPGPLDERPEWASGERADEDVLCDGFRVREDASGAMHAVWAGTSAGRSAFGFQAYYAWRPSGGEWGPPVLLAKPDPVHGLGKSFASGLIVDGDAAMPLLSLDLHSGWRYRGSDTELELFRGGTMRALALTLTRFIRDAMTVNEPAAALTSASPNPVVTLLHAEDGRFWADILVTLAPTRVAAPGVIVWRHLDVTDWRRAVGQ